MKVKIKKIEEENDEVFLLIHCCKPQRKSTPLSGGRDELKKSNELFKEYSILYELEMSDYRKNVQELHLGEAKILQGWDGKRIE